MKKNTFIVICAFLLMTVMSACTSQFDSANEDPTAITDESLTQDFNNIGSFFPSLLANIFGHQVEENLVAESYCDYMATPTPFVNGGTNNTTYYITWGSDYWNREYTSLMSPASQVIDKCGSNYPVFAAWAKLIKIMGMSRLTTYYGPVIYSNFGATTSSVLYDSEKTLYNSFFSELDAIEAVFKANESYVGLTKFDASYSGDITKWERFLNSLRLRLAIRISKADAALAKTQGEKAIADAAGLITDNKYNMYISLYGSELYLGIICYNWDDTRMSAGMESILVGLQDPRISIYFAPVTDATLLSKITDHPAFPYKGIRNGAYLKAKDDHTAFSKCNTSYQTVTSRSYMSASEVYFDLAEAALRGWTGAGDAKTNYESGVTASFAELGASGVSDYLANSTNKPIDYIDPAYDGVINSFKTRSTVTIKWDDSATKEEKLEKIITQKWIAAFDNPNEPWADFRRTGYPKLAHVYRNDSGSTYGVIGADEWIQRLVFVESERTGNTAAVADATTKLGGSDLISTHLWFAPANTSNF